MFPAISSLRRVAASYVLVRPEMLHEECGRVWVRLDRPSAYALLEEGRWGPALSKVPMFELVAKGVTPVDATVALVKKENAIADALHAVDALYTLVLGPEQEDEVVGGVIRRARLTVVRGIFRATGRRVLTTVKARERERVTHRRLPPGAIHERR